MIGLVAARPHIQRLRRLDLGDRHVDFRRMAIGDANGGDALAASNSVKNIIGGALPDCLLIRAGRPDSLQQGKGALWL